MFISSAEYRIVRCGGSMARQRKGRVN